MKWLGMTVLGLALLVQPTAAQAPGSELEGLWTIQRAYAPALRGPLEVTRDGDTWRAAIGGQQAEARANNGVVHFAFGVHGGFRGRLSRSGALEGVWIQPTSRTENRDDPTATSQAFAAPVTLARAAQCLAWRRGAA